MQKTTSPYSKILENEVCTSLEFLLRCGMMIHPVGRWKTDLWNVFSSLQKLKPKYYLNPLFNKNRSWLPRFGDCIPLHEWKRLLLTVDCSHGLVNDCWRFCIHYVIMIFNRRFNCENFFTKKYDYSLCHASLQTSKKNFCSTKSFFAFGQVWGNVSFSFCRVAAWDRFWWCFSLMSHSHSCF